MTPHPFAQCRKDMTLHNFAQKYNCETRNCLPTLVLARKCASWRG